MQPCPFGAHVVGSDRRAAVQRQHELVALLDHPIPVPVQPRQRVARPRLGLLGQCDQEAEGPQRQCLQQGVAAG